MFHIAEMVEDKSTLPNGIGTIPDAVLSSLPQSQRFRCTHGNDYDGIIDLLFNEKQ